MNLTRAIFCILLVCALLICPIGVFADENDQLEGDGEETTTQSGYIKASTPIILPDRNVSFDVVFDGRSALAFTATFEYPSNVMEYKGYQIQIDGFSVSVTQRNGENSVKYLDVFAISTDLVARIEGEVSFISFDFYINKDVKEGTSAYFKMINASVSDGESDFSVPEIAYQGKVSLYDTSVPIVESISINGKKLEGFSNEVSSYFVKVEFSVTVLLLDIVCQEGSSASVRGHENLKVGENTVFIDVTTQTGNTHTYVITVQRLEDPNHVISDDATLSDIKLSAGFVTPKIEKDVLEYVIYLPSGVSELVIEPVTSNEYASAENKTVSIEGNDNATVEIAVTAEDGKICTYIFTLLVTPEFEGKIPIINGEIGNVSNIDFSKEEGLILPLPTKLLEFFEKHGISATELLIAVVVTVLLLVALLALVLILVLKKKKKKAVLYIEDSLENAEIVDKNIYENDSDIETNVF